jgi:asparagine synthase (glutamine-hydrolysing)
MCGIAGVVDTASTSSDVRAALGRMLDTLVHRGPDDSGIWQAEGIALGHRRLSIVDLSPHGRQPMISDSGRYVLVLNGEIYNHKDLRAELVRGGARFRGHSDTEVLLSLIEHRGFDRALECSIGMYAMALWDTHARALHLARDRFGEKPLFYGCHRGRFIFGSELKALVAHPAFARNVDHDSVSSLCRFGYIPAPHTIYRLTSKLPPAHILTLTLDPNGRGGSVERPQQNVRQYWSVETVAIRGLQNPFKGTYEDAVEELESRLADSVKQQMEADVPLGAFLSGGIDSSTVVALMQQQSTQPVKTFSIGFDIAEFNEAKHAEEVSRHLGTDHTEHYLGSKDALAVIPLLPTIYDEPFADPSQIPTYLIARLARQAVTVSLSGDGGDEIFCGYQKYHFARKLSRIPLRGLLGKAVTLLPHRFIDRATKNWSLLGRRRPTASRLATLALLLAARDARYLMELTSTIYRDAQALVPSSTRRPTAFDIVRDPGIMSPCELLAMILDRESFLPDDILHKVDRATMAVSLESRAPFLDHRVVELVSRLPLEYLVNRGQTKRILRAVLYRHVPPHLVDRKKAGFSVPLAAWLRGELRTWAQDLLSSEQLRKDNYFDPNLCQRILKTHLDGLADYSRVLWAILMFQSWRQRWL